MSWLRRLERRLQPLAIPNLTMILIAGMVGAYLISIFNPAAGEMLVFRPSDVLKGEIWRLFTFLLVPGTGVGVNPVSILFFVFFLMLMHLMGSALEATWGTLRYNAFVLISWLASIAGGVLAGAVMGGDAVGTNLYLYDTIFLAFAWLFPDFELMIFFILPVKIKWLALLNIIGLAFAFLLNLATFMDGGWLHCVLMLAGMANLSIFLGRDIANHLRARNRRMLRKFENVGQKPTARHTCIVCGATDLSHPERQFRYCTQCQGTPAYCDQHLAGHQHLTAVTSNPAR